ncbi:MAG: ATP-binding cassette domain-containing protein [Bacilli bacterium]|nr:ATP-binding cassette domain-containing protein [Bacilli bacterium]MCI9434535.1 ATP-binding cassette domain-containing protein [Bacilli bacterium]
MELVIETNNLLKKYKDFKAINNLNMHLEKGAIYGLIGKNGAGKTTLIRLICGLQKPTSGTYTLYGVKNTDKKIIDVRKRIGAIIETPSIYQNMTARDNLIEQFKLIGLPSFDSINDLLELVGLAHTGKKKVKNFSLGMKQRLGIAIALATSPDLLILDEPINGLDPEGIVEIRELILNLNRKKRITILISSHYLDELSKIATHYGFVDNGQVIKEISSDELNKKMEQKIEIKVNDIKEFVKYFEKKHYTYEVIEPNTINVYGKFNLAKFISELAKNNLVAEDIHEKEATLENYYLNLIGGKNYD